MNWGDGADRPPARRRVTDAPRRLSVDPTVHVETFATHCSLTWTAGGLGRFLAAAGDLEGVPETAPAVVDRTTTAGRERRQLSALAAEEATRYVRVEPPAGWTLSWERRNRPVVSLSGTPPAACRRLHVATTDCPAWPDDARAALSELAAVE